MNSDLKVVLKHAGLFILTFITTSIAGAEWMYGKTILSNEFTWMDFYNGMHYSVPFLLILAAHEFGHYFTARYYRINTSLPYFIPLPPVFFSLGTMGALIRIRERIHSKKQNFDIGIAGPLAGFVVTIGVLVYGFVFLPPPEYVFQFHPEYEQYGLAYAKYVYDPMTMPEGSIDLIIGKNLLFVFFEKFVGDPSRVPNVHELMHYPYLFAGFLALVFTSINLLPIGQLDGGHVLYGLLGFEGHRKIASLAFIIFLFYAGLGFTHPSESQDVLLWKIPAYIFVLYLSLYGFRMSKRDTLMYAVGLFAFQYIILYFIPTARGYNGWLLFTLIIGRFIGIRHPPTLIEEELDQNRKLLGWIALGIFIISFSANPIESIE